MESKIPKESPLILHNYKIPRENFLNCINCCNSNSCKNKNNPLKSYPNCSDCFNNLVNFWLYSLSDKKLLNIIKEADTYAHLYSYKVECEYSHRLHKENKLIDVELSIWKIKNGFICEVDIEGNKKIFY